MIGTAGRKRRSCATHGRLRKSPFRALRTFQSLFACWQLGPLDSICQPICYAHTPLIRHLSLWVKQSMSSWHSLSSLFSSDGSLTASLPHVTLSESRPNLRILGSETPEERTATSSLGFRPKNVTQEMVRLVPCMSVIYAAIQRPACSRWIPLLGCSPIYLRECLVPLNGMLQG